MGGGPPCSNTASRGDIRGKAFRKRSLEIYLNSLIQPDKALLVSVVDDDESVRESLPDLLNELGYSVRTFSSALEFLASDALDQTWCLLLDITMPGMSGMELQAELKRRDKRTPIIFITATEDDAVRARVVELGAVACLRKPFSDTALLEALRSVAVPAR